MDSFNDTRETLDLLFQGKLQLYQRRKGYRISLDPILLGHFMSVRQGDRVMDLGTGNGILPLVLAHLHPSLSITGLELQEEMAARAARNIRLNGFDGRVRIACLDVCSVADHFASESFDAVISNPPYRTSKSGRLSPDSERQIARHETRGTLEDFIHAAGYLLRPKGRFALIYIAGRSVDLVTSMRAHQIEPKCLRMVHSFIAAGAAMVLVEGVKGGKPGIKILPPLVVYNRRHNYTAEIRSLLSGAPMKAQAARRNE